MRRTRRRKSSVTYWAEIMKVFLITGEASGDKHGAHLAMVLKRLDPGIRLCGIGGPMMRDAGITTLADISGFNAFQYRYLPRLLYRGRLNRMIREYCRFLERERQDAVVIIGLADDTTYVAMKIARVTREIGIPVFYYFAPHVWIWSAKKTKRVAAAIDYILTTFPQEEREYKEAGARTIYVGHPIIDEIEEGRRDRGFLRGDLGLGDKKAVVLFPGSRSGELRYHLPIMGKIMQELEKDMKQEDGEETAYIVSALNDRFRKKIEEYFSHKSDVHVVTGNVYDLIVCADAVVTSSGTITLEIALHEKPQVIIYRVPWITYLIGRTLIGFKYIGMPNVIMERIVVPEFLQGAIDPKKIAGIVTGLLRDDESVDSMKHSLRELKDRLGGGGAIDRAAKAILEIAGKKTEKQDTNGF